MANLLAEKLKFSWDEVHAVAEELEHVSSKKLIEKLDEFREILTRNGDDNPEPSPISVLGRCRD